MYEAAAALTQHMVLQCFFVLSKKEYSQCSNSYLIIPELGRMRQEDHKKRRHLKKSVL
jgi:hypothetical protein